jgi:hypothetical protein
LTAPSLSISTANGRYYYHPRRANQVPSVTNILGQKAKPGLIRWSAGQSAEYAADNLDKLQPLDRSERVQLIKNAPFQKSDASRMGDIVHDWIDRHIKGERVSQDEFNAAPITARHMMESFWAFNNYYKPEFIESEFTIWNETYGYAGTGDWYGKLNGALLLVDNKTGNRTYWDTGMQLAAVSKGEFILDTDGTERALPKFERFAILHIRPTFFKLVPVQHIEECFAGFLGLKASFDLEVNYGDNVLGYAPQVKTSTIKEG